MSTRLDRVLAAIDAANSGDPETIVVGGVARPKELAHAELASMWVLRLRPGASEELRIAARGHHVQRWRWPRSDEPPGRAGYLRWRRGLQDRHAGIVAALMSECGYDSEAIARVDDLMHKRRLRTDPETQAYEDALALTFVQTQLAGMAVRTDHDKLVDIVAKTIAKMSPAAVEAAAGLGLGEGESAVIADALRRRGPQPPGGAIPPGGPSGGG